MTTNIGYQYLTLLDYAKRESPAGGIDEIIEVLAASNPILQDANVMEGNLVTGHRSTQRVTQPTGSWRLLNYGVATEKSTTKQVDDLCGILESYSQLDINVAKLGGNEAAFRASEDNAFIAGMNSTVATALFYGNQNVNPEQIQGFAPRYNAISGGAYANQIVNAGGAGTDDNTSMWVITWSPLMCSMIYPKGSSAGLTSKDMGEQIVTDSNGLKYTALVTRFQWMLGLMIKDYRYVIRIANIDVSALTEDASAGANLMSKMIDAYYARPTVDIGPDMARTFIYCNKTIATYLHKQAMMKNNVNLTIDNSGGKPMVGFLGAPIRVCDALVNTEAAVS